MCDVCGDLSGGKDVGVAAVPAAPVSVMWCDNCLRENAVPLFVVETWLFSPFEQYDVEMPDEPPEKTLAPWALEMKIWYDDRYQTITEVLPTLWKIEREKVTNA